MYQYGITMPDILEELNFMRAPSARGKEAWNKTALKYLLQNEKYIGDVRLTKSYVWDALTYDFFCNKIRIFDTHIKIIEMESEYGRCKYHCKTT